MLADTDRVVIVGAGQAGAWAARTLRDVGFAGEVVLLGAEPHAPYERPPLSKDVLHAAETPPVPHVFPLETYAKQRIEFRPGVVVSAIQPRRRVVVLEEGGELHYSRLILCTGGRARPLPLAPNGEARLHTLRTIDDARALRAGMANARSLAIIGGGWIGLEIASAARKAGVATTVIEAAAGLCTRVLPRDVSEWLAHRHAAQGVDLRLATAVCAVGASGSQIQIDLGSSRLRADMAVVGVGLVPNDELAGEAGLKLDGGIVVDANARTSDANIYAAGDVTNAPNSAFGGRVRLESWQNAQDQGIVAAKSAAGLEAVHDPLPWFWSDQYGTSLQIYGFPARGERAVMRGAFGHSTFLVCYMAGDRIVSAIGHNAARELRPVRRLIEHSVAVSDDQLRNPEVNLAWLPLAAH